MSWALLIGEIALSAFQRPAAVLTSTDVLDAYTQDAHSIAHSLPQAYSVVLRLPSATANAPRQEKLLCRDIKLENTLLDDAQPQPNVKICDFGYSKNEFVDSRPKTVSGTPDYIAPEVLMADQYDGKKADIWSCGVMLYVMVTGETA